MPKPWDKCLGENRIFIHVLKCHPKGPCWLPRGKGTLQWCSPAVTIKWSNLASPIGGQLDIMCFLMGQNTQHRLGIISGKKSGFRPKLQFIVNTGEWHYELTVYRQLFPSKSQCHNKMYMCGEDAMFLKIKETTTKCRL